MSLASLFGFPQEPAKLILIWKSGARILYTILLFKIYYFLILTQHSTETVHIDLISKSNETKPTSSIPK